MLNMISYPVEDIHYFVPPLFLLVLLFYFAVSFFCTWFGGAAVHVQVHGINFISLRRWKKREEKREKGRDNTH